jgi:hypothetical protein
MILINSITACINPISGLLEKLIDEAHAERRRRHEERMQEIAMIANSNLRDDYVQQLLLDKFLAPIEKAQHKLQDAAKHAQWLAEIMNYYHQDHGATQEQGKEISGQLRILATKITELNSLYDLKIIYKATTLFAHQLSTFKHHDRKYSLERSIRDGILNVLNTCIAVENNFQRRAAWTNKEQDKTLSS